MTRSTVVARRNQQLGEMLFCLAVLLLIVALGLGVWLMQSTGGCPAGGCTGPKHPYLGSGVVVLFVGVCQAVTLGALAMFLQSGSGDQTTP
jgi:hypothetical protein